MQYQSCVVCAALCFAVALTGGCIFTATPGERESGSGSDTAVGPAPDTSVEDGGKDYAVAFQAPNQLTFEWPGLDASGRHSFRLRNTGDRPLTIDELRFGDNPDEVFRLDPESLPNKLAAGEPYALSSGEHIESTVVFSPAAREAYDGELIVDVASGGGQTHTIDLTSTSPDNDCPDAVARARLKNSEQDWVSELETEADKTVQLSAADSEDPDGAIDEYEWSVTERSANSTAELAPSSDVADPTLFLDRSGSYRVELVVEDDAGRTNCGGPATVHIEATADEGGVTVELSWRTPADGDQTDTNGADVDLHYRNARGQWQEEQWDIFWHQQTADWGEEGDNSDDPEMTTDNTNGSGPERVVHPNPIEDQVYHIGVHYYDDNGFGPSYAVVRLYDSGELVAKFGQKYLQKTFSFWHVAKFTGYPTESVETIDETFEEMPNRGE
jgi:hypothetical protein